MTTQFLRNATFLLVAAALAALPAQAQTRVTVTNAATFEQGFPVSPGAWATAFADFASVGVSNTAATAVPFPTMLGGVQVFVDGAAAPMNFAGELQINFLVPKGTSEGNVPLRVDVGGMTTYEGALRVHTISPGFLPGAVLNQDNTVNSQDNPAQRGEVVQIFGVGADFPLDELPEDGAEAPLDTLIRNPSEPRVLVSVFEAEVQFSGVAPGLANAWQLNIVVPGDEFPDGSALSGEVPVQAVVRGVPTNRISIWVAE